MMAMSACSISKSKMSAFSQTRSLVTVLGKGRKPCCKLQRKTSWPTVLVYFSASSLSASMSNILPVPKGL